MAVSDTRLLFSKRKDKVPVLNLVDQVLLHGKRATIRSGKQTDCVLLKHLFAYRVIMISIRFLDGVGSQKLRSSVSVL